ncbi:MAG: FAD-dependent oxidoreductase [Bacteroidota bacterium]
MDNRRKYIIIGAGLSGLVTAYALQKAGITDFIILEARDRTGGRIYTKNGIDLGATWFQNHHVHLNHLLNELSLDKFEQYASGKSILIYNTMAPPHYFESHYDGPSAYRITSGSMALISKLSGMLKEKIHLNTSVLAIQEKNEELELQSGQNTLYAEKVVITLPPKLAATLNFGPELSNPVLKALENTHTWMSNAMKVGIQFDSPFWRTKGFSGTIVGQVGPVIELYDHTDHKEEKFSLMGFINEGLRDVSAEIRKEKILSYLEKHLGKEIRSYVSYSEKDWSLDPYTSCKELKSVYMSPQYGNPIFDEWHFNGKLLFSGTETSPIHGGYLDGAVFSGLKAAKQIINGN